MSHRCFESHPALPLSDGYVVYGGSCSSPIVKDADVFIGFDGWMRLRGTARPWDAHVCTEILVPVYDHEAPEDAEDFKRLIDWSAEQIRNGKKLHAGCIGGHGRTGVFLSALVAQFMGRTDAIQYVRKHYCDKAVESRAQVDFLAEHFGVERVPLSSRRYSGYRTDDFRTPVHSYARPLEEEVEEAAWQARLQDYREPCSGPAWTAPKTNTYRPALNSSISVWRKV